MFITIVGSRLSGKSTVKEYLINKYGFIPVRLIEGKQNSYSSKERKIHDLNDSRSNSPEFLQAPPPELLEGYRASYDDHHGYRPESFLLMNSPVSANFPSLTTRSITKSHENSRDTELVFYDTDDLLDHVTRHWRADFVTSDLISVELLAKFVIRPFCMVVDVDAPILTRYQRSLKSDSTTKLEDFVRDHDIRSYGKISRPSTTVTTKTSSTGNIDKLVNVRVLNAFDTISALHTYLDGLHLTNPERLRPGWDTYFMQLASLASLRSNCMKRRVGAILVRKNRILATGYNGTPRGLTNCNEGGCLRCNSASEISDECVCLHAEENALLEAGRERIGDGSVLYCNTCPCLKCTIKIIQTGVKEVVYNLSYKVDDASAALFREAGVKLRRHAPPPEQ